MRIKFKYAIIPLLFLLINTSLSYNQDSIIKLHDEIIDLKYRNDFDKIKLSEIQKEKDELKDRLLKLETQQVQRDSMISSKDTFWASLITILVVVVGYAVYLSNKKYVKELSEKHKEIDEKQKKLENYVDKQKEIIKNIINEQKFYHFEIFNTICIYYMELYIAKEQSGNLNTDIDKALDCSNIILYGLISANKLDKTSIIHYEYILNDLKYYILKLKKYINHLLKENIDQSANIHDLYILTKNIKYSILNFCILDENYKNELQICYDLLKSYNATNEIEEEIKDNK